MRQFPVECGDWWRHDMKLMTENIGGRDIQIALFAVPMMHEDWHEAEEAGFVYVTYQHEGPDYWDDSMVFTGGG